MRAGSAPTRATPYVVVARYTRPNRSVIDYRLTTHKHLDEALTVIREATLAWLRLVGGQFTPMRWVVIDTRDYSEWHEGPNPMGDNTSEHTTQGYLYHQRNPGTVLAERRPARGGGGPGLLDRYRL